MPLYPSRGPKHLPQQLVTLQQRLSPSALEELPLTPITPDTLGGGQAYFPRG